MWQKSTRKYEFRKKISHFLISFHQRRQKKYEKDVNTKNNKGYTPLYEAVWNSDANMVGLLVLNAADVDAKDNYGYIPLSWVVWNEDRDRIVKQPPSGPL